MALVLTIYKSACLALPYDNSIASLGISMSLYIDLTSSSKAGGSEYAWLSVGQHMSSMTQGQTVCRSVMAQQS